MASTDSSNNELYTQSPSGLRDSYQRNGTLTHEEWLTDLDIEHCLQSYDNINQRYYVAAPVELNQNQDFIANRFKEALEKHQHNPLQKALFPVCSHQHWRLIIATINSAKQIALTVWSPMSQPPTDKKTAKNDELINTIKNVAKQAIQRDIEPQIEYAGVQNNGYSCGDWVIKKTLEEMDIQNNITQAQDSRQLRQEIEKTILPSMQNNVQPMPEKNNSQSAQDAETAKAIAEKQMREENCYDPYYLILQNKEALKQLQDHQQAYKQHNGRDMTIKEEIAFIDKTLNSDTIKQTFFGSTYQPSSQTCRQQSKSDTIPPTISVK